MAWAVAVARKRTTFNGTGAFITQRFPFITIFTVVVCEMARAVAVRLHTIIWTFTIATEAHCGADFDVIYVQIYTKWVRSMKIWILFI